MIALGVDMFDCVLPSRVARNGLAFTPEGPINLRNEKFKADPRPVVDGLDNYTCQELPREGLPEAPLCRRRNARGNAAHDP